MITVLCEIDDVPALAFAERVRRRGVPCLAATSAELSFARRRTQWLSPHGVDGLVDFGGDRAVRRPAFVLNRLGTAPDQAWRWAAAEERDYASAELFAFTLSWLAGLDCPVRNRPDAPALAGPARHPLLLAAAATAAGLDCPTVAMGHRALAEGDPVLEAALQASDPAARSVHVVCLDGEVLDASVPARIADAIAVFTGLVDAGDALVGVDFLVTDDRWIFAGLAPMADLSVGGAELIERVLQLAKEPAP